ncbi:hypothetical protein [Streptomyces sp. NPDC059783]|uniref:hypothetical protein n=1 Tax=Streptomyces sp. NPDC059783 TaxID=3346944 RepID=UPI003666D660
MTEPEHNVAASVCDHAYEIRILGGHPLSVRICTLCRTPDWADLYEQADALFRWGREEGLAGKPPRTSISAYDRPTETDDHAPGHVYLSTGCLHGQHGYCQSMTGQQGRKRPAECKFCQARCICPCHNERESR